MQVFNYHTCIVLSKYNFLKIVYSKTLQQIPRKTTRQIYNCDKNQPEGTTLIVGKASFSLPPAATTCHENRQSRPKVSQNHHLNTTHLNSLLQNALVFLNELVLARTRYPVPDCLLIRWQKTVFRKPEHTSRYRLYISSFTVRDYWYFLFHSITMLLIPQLSKRRPIAAERIYVRA